MNERFDELFEDDAYLNLKNWLFSYQLRRRHLRALLDGRSDQRILDLGCGISPIVGPAANVVYVDISFQALRHLSRQHPQASFVVADVSRLPFKNGAVPRALCSEVLEHVEHDDRTLGEISRVLEPGGHVLISLPIHRYYYTFDDSYVGHFRRYELPELIPALQSRGFATLRVRKVAGALEKVATYIMARSFALLSRNQTGRANPLGRGRRWWFFPYKIGNSVWSYVCWLESKITPLALTTIVSIEGRKAAGERPGPSAPLRSQVLERDSDRRLVGRYPRKQHVDGARIGGVPQLDLVDAGR